MQLSSVDYFGHNLTEFVYKNNQKGLVNKDRKDITSLNIDYGLSEGKLEDDNKVIVVFIHAKISALSNDNTKVFELEIEYQSLFKVDCVQGINSDFFHENEWFFTKFIHRSGKTIFENLLSQTEYKHVQIPSFLKKKIEPSVDK